MGTLPSLIDVEQPGRTLRYAWVPGNAAGLGKVVKGLRCPVCSRSLGQRSFIDESVQIQDIHYLKRKCNCRCGFENFWYIITNLMREDQPLASLAEVEQSLTQLEQEALIEDPIYETGVYALAVAAERGDHERAIQVAERLVASYRGDETLFFYLGYFYGEVNRLGDAMMAYHNARRLKPDFLDPIYNQGIILTRMGRLEDGRAFLSVYDDLVQGKKTLNALPDEERLLIKEEGLFGMVAVLDSGLYRRLIIEQQSQGSAFCVPTSQDFALAADPGPGALPESPYTIGMMLPGALHPEGNGLVLGLGSGIGVTLLLAAFLKLNLTVVEMDPVIIRLARTYFPLVAYYEQAQRLQVVEGDAFEYVEHSSNNYDFCLLDLYQGDPEQPSGMLQPGFVKSLAALCNGSIWPNLIGRPSSDYFKQVVQTFTSLDVPLRFMSAGVDVASRNSMDRNWICSTEALDLKTALDQLCLNAEEEGLDQPWLLFPKLEPNHALRLVRQTLLAYIEMDLPLG